MQGGWAADLTWESEEKTFELRPEWRGHGHGGGSNMKSMGP